MNRAAKLQWTGREARRLSFDFQVPKKTGAHMAPPKRTINVEMYIFYSYIWRSCTIPCYGTRRQANLKSPRLDCNLWCILSLPARPFFCNLNGTGSPDEFFYRPIKLNQFPCAAGLF